MFPHDHSELHKREKTARGRIGRRTERVGWGCHTQRERKRARWGEKAEGTGGEKVEQEKWLGDGELQEER